MACLCLKTRITLWVVRVFRLGRRHGDARIEPFIVSSAQRLATATMAGLSLPAGCPHVYRSSRQSPRGPARSGPQGDQGRASASAGAGNLPRPVQRHGPVAEIVIGRGRWHRRLGGFSTALKLRVACLSRGIGWRAGRRDSGAVALRQGPACLASAAPAAGAAGR